MNDYINFLQDSIDTSVDMKIFNNREDASMAHIFKSKLFKIPLSVFKNTDNFDPARLQKSAVKAYPIDNRPRCNNDLTCVKYYQKQIQEKKESEISPIWMILKNEKYILLDGAHRIVASYIEEKNHINAYVIIL